MVLDRSRLVAQDAHDELLEGGGLYATLYQRQFRSTPQKPSKPLVPTNT